MHIFLQVDISLQSRQASRLNSLSNRVLACQGKLSFLSGAGKAAPKDTDGSAGASPSLTTPVLPLSSKLKLQYLRNLRKYGGTITPYIEVVNLVQVRFFSGALSHRLK